MQLSSESIRIIAGQKNDAKCQSRRFGAAEISAIGRAGGVFKSTSNDPGLYVCAATTEQSAKSPMLRRRRRPFEDVVELEVLAAGAATLHAEPNHLIIHENLLAARSIVRVTVHQAWIWPSSNL